MYDFRARIRVRERVHGNNCCSRKGSAAKSGASGTAAEAALARPPRNDTGDCARSTGQVNRFHFANTQPIAVGRFSFFVFRRL